MKNTFAPVNVKIETIENHPELCLLTGTGARNGSGRCILTNWGNLGALIELAYENADSLSDRFSAVIL